MHVSITRRAARRTRAGRIRQVDEDETRAAARATGHGTDSNSVVKLLVDDDVVRRADGQAVEVAREVVLGEGNGARRVDVEQLAPVEDLDTVVAGLAADDDVVLVAADLAPDGGGRVLGQAAEVDERALRGDLGEGGAVGLGDDDELTAFRRCPAPGGGALAGGRAEVGVADEVVEVDLERVRRRQR